MRGTWPEWAGAAQAAPDLVEREFGADAPDGARRAMESGGSQISTEDMTAFTDFIDTILFQPNPNQRLDRMFPDSVAGGNLAIGFSNFVNLELAIQGEDATPRSCNSCHLASPEPGSDRSIKVFQEGDNTQPLKVPHLRNLYQKVLFNAFGPESIDGFGFNHEGRVPDLRTFFEGQAFRLNTDQQATDIAAFLLAFDTRTAPAVGYLYTFASDNNITLIELGKYATASERSSYRQYRSNCTRHDWWRGAWTPYISRRLIHTSLTT